MVLVCGVAAVSVNAHASMGIYGKKQQKAREELDASKEDEKWSYKNVFSGFGIGES